MRSSHLGAQYLILMGLCFMNAQLFFFTEQQKFDQYLMHLI